MNKNNLNCIFKCPQVEDQEHSFTNCRPILKNIENGCNTTYEDIFGTLTEQTKSIQTFPKI